MKKYVKLEKTSVYSLVIKKGTLKVSQLVFFT